MVDVPPATIVVWSDLACPWAHVAVHRLHRARRALDLDGVVRFDHRPFVLEIANSRPTPKRVLDAEIPVAGALEPGAGWEVWQDDPSRWPVTTLLPLEAVQAAKEQGSGAAEELDRALRVAFFGHSRCISLRSVVLRWRGSVGRSTSTGCGWRWTTGGPAARCSITTTLPPPPARVSPAAPTSSSPTAATPTTRASSFGGRASTAGGSRWS